MPRDTRTYITLHDGMVQNKKIMPLSDKAFRTYIELLSWCSRERSDGLIPAAVFRMFGTAPARNILVTSGLIEVTGDSYSVHDYLEHQRSREDIEKLTKARSEAGKLGAAKTNRAAKESASAAASDAAKARQSSGKVSAETETDTDTSPNGEVEGAPQAPPAAKNARRTRIPDPFIVTPEMVAWAQKRVPGLDGRLSTERFINHFTAVGGAKGLMADWTAAWRNWLLADYDRGQNMLPNAPRPVTGRMTRGQERDAELMDFMTKADSQGPRQEITS